MPFGAGEVCPDYASDYVGTRSLCGNDHVYAYGTCFLCYAGNRSLGFLSYSHDEIGIFVDDDNDVGKVTVSFFGVKLTLGEKFVVMGDLNDLGFHEQVISVPSRHKAT